MRVLLVLIHGIGFTKVGDLDSTLKDLSLHPNQKSIEANWNTIASAEYTNSISYSQVSKLSKALNSMATLRPRTHYKNRYIRKLSEAVLDLIDISFAAIFWIIIPISIMFADFKYNPTELDSRIFKYHISLSTINYLIILYAAASGFSILIITLLAWTKSRAIFLSQSLHLNLIFIRPLLVLSYLFMVAFSKPIRYFFLYPISLVSILFLVEIFDPNRDVNTRLYIFVFGTYIIMPILVSLIFAPILKLFFDIILYISDKKYRMSILHDLEEQIMDNLRTNEITHLVIIGHSLGSVIAVNHLLLSEHIGRFQHITLVTAGSPIRRMFQRILPDHLIYHNNQDIIRYISNITSFKWINYYRKFDIVGTALNLPRSDQCLEGCSPLIANPVRSHINYWTDPHFIRFIYDNWKPL